MKISVIVPAYNAEDSLEKCIDSLMAQTLPFYEILLLDDGSNDETGSVCDRMAGKYDSVKSYHCEHRGSSATRNYGIDIASGDYIMFVDSDDVIETDACEQLTEALAGRYADVIAVNATVHYINGKIREYRHDYCDSSVLHDGEEYFLNEYRKNTMNICLIYYVFSREYLNRIALRYIEGYCCEDEAFIPTGIVCADTVLGTNVNYYHHLKHVGSLTYPKNPLYKAESVIVMCGYLEILSERVKNDELRARLLDHALDIFYQLYTEADLYHHKDMRLGKDKMKKFAFSKKNKLRNVMFFTCEPILSVLEKIRRNLKVRICE